MRESIRGYADAVIEESGEGRPGRLRRLLPGGGSDTGLTRLSDDLRSVADLVRASGELRGVLTDPGVAPHVRRGVVTDLLTGRIGEPALRLVTFVVGAGRAPDLIEDLDLLVPRVDAARQGLHPVGPRVLGHHAALERLDGYAAAVLGADGVELSEVEDELFRFERIVTGSPELTTALSESDLPPEARAALVVDLLGERASAASTHLAAYATTIGRPREYPDLLRALVDRVAAERQRRFAEVRAAVEMTDEQRIRLAQALAGIVGQPVEVRVVVDPSVLGGFVATIGDTVVDGSVRHRLDLLSERLGAHGGTPTNQGAQS